MSDEAQAELAKGIVTGVKTSVGVTPKIELHAPYALPRDTTGQGKTAGGASGRVADGPKAVLLEQAVAGDRACWHRARRRPRGSAASPSGAWRRVRAEPWPYAPPLPRGGVHRHRPPAGESSAPVQDGPPRAS